MAGALTTPAARYTLALAHAACGAHADAEAALGVRGWGDDEPFGGAAAGPVPGGAAGHLLAARCARAGGRARARPPPTTQPPLPWTRCCGPRMKVC